MIYLLGSSAITAGKTKVGISIDWYLLSLWSGLTPNLGRNAHTTLDRFEVDGKFKYKHLALTRARITLV